MKIATEIPDKIHEKMKILAIKQKTTFKQLLIDALEEKYE